jgi:hypothetical protein
MDGSDDLEEEGVGFTLSEPSPALLDLQVRIRDSMETALDCVRLLIADGARLQEAAAAGVLISDNEAGPEIGVVAPHRPVDQVRAAMSAPDALLFRQVTVIAAAALGWAAMQTDRTVAEVLSELDDLMPG